MRGGAPSDGTDDGVGEGLIPLRWGVVDFIPNGTSLHAVRKGTLILGFGVSA